MRIEATPTLVRLWFKGDDVFKDVFNQHIVGAELTGETVLGGGVKQREKDQTDPLGSPYPFWTCSGKYSVHWQGSLEVLRRSGLPKVGSHFLSHLERERDVCHTESCEVTECPSSGPSPGLEFRET